MNKVLLPGFIATTALFSVVLAATHDFVPDTVFKGSSLAGLRTIGSGDWRAANGEIYVTPKSAEGAWLVLDKGYQDIQFYTEFRCTGPCNAGLLLRSAKTPEGGLKGIYVSLSDNDINSYDLTLGPDGKEVSRTRLERASAQFAR